MKFERAIIQPPVFPEMQDPYEDFPFFWLLIVINPGKAFTPAAFPLLTTLIKSKKTKLAPS